VSDGQTGDWPSVSVVVPVRNEARHLRAAVAAILAQDYPLPFDVCLAVAPSTDETTAIAQELSREDPRISVVDNPAGVTPAGLNAAIRATRGEVVVRVDGHAALSPGYIRRAVQTMQRTGAVNVGGVQRATGSTPFERAVAMAMTSKWGVGGARFHTGGAEGAVDTVYLGVFRREAIERAGLFDQRLVRNQDYELNIRLRNAGGVVWFDPDLWVEYRPRSSVRALARQYFEYGQWKRHVVAMYPRSMKPRQMIPPVVTAAVVAGVGVGVWWRPALLAPVGYALGVVAAAIQIVRRPFSEMLRVAVALPTMHLSWGAGFLSALVRRPALRGARGSARTPTA
jgi:succinoglycan biosynthesis protein ExoA